MGFLDYPNEYESWINREGLHMRSPRLKDVIQAIKNYVINQNGNNLTAVKSAVDKWKEMDHKEYGHRGLPLQSYLDKEIAEHGKRVWGLGAIRMVDHTCHPKYEPHKWMGLIQSSTNCYAYACDDPYGHPQNTMPQPGQAAGYWDWIRLNPQGNIEIKDSSVRYAVMRDDMERHNRRLASLIPLIRLRNDPIPDLVVNVPGHYLIALVTDHHGRDYHWLRQDDNGMWSHKPGLTPVTNLDASGNLISDPRTCDLLYPGLWYEFTTFYYVPKGGVRTGELGNA
jgi:hypothetical protein